MLHHPLRLICDSVLSTAAALLIATPALAHHSRGMYDMEREFTLVGTVTALQWNNPHIHLYISVLDENGEARNWALEGNSPAIMSEQGWPQGGPAPGEEISVVIIPLKGGARGGLIRRARFADGSEFIYLGGPDSVLRDNPPVP